MRKRISIKISKNLKYGVKGSNKFRYLSDFIKESISYFLGNYNNIEFLHIFWDKDEERFSTTFMCPLDMNNRLIEIQNKKNKDIAYLVEYAVHSYYKYLKDTGIL